MQDTGKPGLMLVMMKIVIGVIVIVGITACQATSNTTVRVSPQSTSHTVTIHASLAHNYTSLKELKKDSVLIVLGTVNSQMTSIGNHGIPYTTSTLNVERTLVGKSTKSVLERQIGGVMANGSQLEVDGFPLLRIGSRYVLFLTPSPVPMQMYPVGAFEGVFVVDTNNHVSSLNVQGLPIKVVPLDTFVQQVQSA